MFDFFFSILVIVSYHHTTTVLRPFFRNHPGEPVPEENVGLCGARED